MLTKVCLVKAMVFPIVMYGCESWIIKKAECRGIDAFELWCWRRLWRVPWTARRSNQSVLKEISPGCSLEGLMLKLKLQYFSYLMQRIDSLEKTLMLGKIEGRRRRGQRVRWLGGITEKALGTGDEQGSLVCCSPWGCKELDTTEWLNWAVTSLFIDMAENIPSLTSKLPAACVLLALISHAVCPPQHTALSLSPAHQPAHAPVPLLTLVTARGWGCPNPLAKSHPSRKPQPETEKDNVGFLGMEGFLHPVSCS